MKHTTALKLASQVLDAELAEFQSNPQDYCEAMNWAPDSIATKKALKNADKIAVTMDDKLELALIIMDAHSDNILELCESNKVNDFKVNCIAKHIVSSK